MGVPVDVDQRGRRGGRSRPYDVPDLWLSGRGPDLGREVSGDEDSETLTSFLHAGIGGGPIS